MNNLAGICLFIASMAALSIPIIAILKWRSKNRRDDGRIDQLETRVRELEQRNQDQQSEIHELSDNVRFAPRLTEKRQRAT